MSFNVLVKNRTYTNPAFKKFHMHCYALMLVYPTKKRHMEIMLEKLQPYGIVYDDPYGMWYIDWVDEAHWTWFIVRWS
jgi:hypothetical protein